MSYTHEVVGLRYSDMIKTKDEINDNIDGCEAYYNSDFFGVIVLSTEAKKHFENFATENGLDINGGNEKAFKHAENILSKP